MNENPLVSVCVTFFSAERYIHRLIESCLNQTYRNVEIVIVDDASIDGSEKIIREYVKQDPRVKYFRNAERERFMLSITKAFKLAKGEFSMLIGADDWLARDYVERGVRTFREHPEAAGIVPRMIGLFETEENKFKFRNEVLGGFYPPQVRSAEWFAKQAYKMFGFYVAALALLRRKDMVSATDYFIENYCKNTNTPVPDDVRELFWKGFGIDTMLFLEILSRYKEFVFDSSLTHVNIAGTQTLSFHFGITSLKEIFKGARNYTLAFRLVYETKWPRFYRRMKTFLAAEALSSAYIHFLRSGFRPSFLNLGESGGIVREVFEGFSVFETAAVVLYSIWLTVYRSLKFANKLFIKEDARLKESQIFTRENYLDSEGRFAV